jgi:hypothetical protein
MKTKQKIQHAPSELFQKNTTRTVRTVQKSNIFLLNFIKFQEAFFSFSPPPPHFCLGGGVSIYLRVKENIILILMENIISQNV